MAEIAEDVLNNSPKDQPARIPVIFPLSRWPLCKESIEDWFVKDLQWIYGIAEASAQSFIRNDEILPLLEGLDELKEEHRDHFVEAINRFRETHQLPMAVSCRTDVYDRLGRRLRLPAALVVEPLSRIDVESYLDSGHEQFDGLRRVLAEERSVFELLDSPLMLDVARRTFDGAVEVTKLKSGNLSVRRRALFDAYIDRMFLRRPLSDFRKEQMGSGLTWLACSMTRLGHTIFWLESLNHEWVPEQRVEPGPWTGAAFGTLFGLIHSPKFTRLRPVDALQCSWPVLRAELAGLMAGITALTVASVAAVKIIVLSRESIAVFASIPWIVAGLCGLLSGVVSGIVGILLSTIFAVVLSPVAGGSRPMPITHKFYDFTAFRLSRSVAFHIGGLLSLSFGIAIGLFAIPLDRAVQLAVVYGCVGWLFFAMEDALVPVEFQKRPTPNAGTRNSGKMGLIYGVLYGTVYTGSAWSILELSHSWSLEWIDRITDWLTTSIGDVGLAVLSGFLISLAFGSERGGDFFVRHWCVRVLLWRYGYAPLRYVRFLDQAVARGLLRRLGNGYAFAYPLLMEHFATRDDTTPATGRMISASAPEV